MKVLEPRFFKEHHIQTPENPPPTQEKTDKQTNLKFTPKRTSYRFFIVVLGATLLVLGAKGQEVLVEGHLLQETH